MEVRSPWIKTNLMGPYSTWISATCCALWTFHRRFIIIIIIIIIICFTLPCVLQITDT